MKRTRILLSAFALLLAVCFLFSGCDLVDRVLGGLDTSPTTTARPTVHPDGKDVPAITQPDFDLSQVPEFTEEPFFVINDNVPSFTEEQLTVESYEFYSELDHLDRCGVAVSSIGKDLMPTEERGSIGSVKPSGWQTVKYDIVNGKYLYNRCHLIGFQLTGENANRSNLVTGTRFMNVDGMLPFENLVADYVKETGNHVLYRVTPIFVGNELVCRGVHMEALSVEDSGEGVSFNVYVYNNQPGITINYKDGTSHLTK